jgi:hypothetical protein
MAYMMKGLLVSVLMAAVVAAPSLQKTSGDTPRPAQEDEIREAVYRYQFKNFDLLVAYHFISVNGKNPSAAILQRFKGEQPPVLPLSDCDRIKKPTRMIQNRNDLKQGALFNIGQIKWISDTKVDVDGGFECGDICDEATGVYHASKPENKWVVDSFDAIATPAKPKK